MLAETGLKGHAFQGAVPYPTEMEEMTMWRWNAENYSHDLTLEPLRKLAGYRGLPWKTKPTLPGLLVMLLKDVIKGIIDGVRLKAIISLLALPMGNPLEDVVSLEDLQEVSLKDDWRDIEALLAVGSVHSLADSFTLLLGRGPPPGPSLLWSHLGLARSGSALLGVALGS